MKKQPPKTAAQLHKRFESMTHNLSHADYGLYHRICDFVANKQIPVKVRVEFMQLQIDSIPTKKVKLLIALHTQMERLGD